MHKMGTPHETAWRLGGQKAVRAVGAGVVKVIGGKARAGAGSREEVGARWDLMRRSTT